jgi:hypothetical protein
MDDFLGRWSPFFIGVLEIEILVGASRRLSNRHTLPLFLLEIEAQCLPLTCVSYQDISYSYEAGICNECLEV